VSTLHRRHRRSLFHAVSRWCALALAVLSALPFTAPFSTFDLRLTQATKVVHRSLPVEGPVYAPSIADAEFFFSSIGVPEDLKNLALAAATASPFRAGVTTAPFTANVFSAHAAFALVASPILRI
jgi:hypothetical protein